MKEIKERINEMIRNYNIRIISQNGEEYIKCSFPNRESKERDASFIKMNKELIIEAIKMKQRKEAEREEKIKNIIGLKEIETNIFEWGVYHEKWERYISGAIEKAPVKPNITTEELMNEFPRAAAYLKAKDFQCSYNHIKSALGSEAVNRIIFEEESYDEVISDMEQKWEAYCMEHAWD